MLSELTAQVEGLGLRLAPAKTGIIHIDEGVRFLGMRDQAAAQRTRTLVYTFFPTKRVLNQAKVKALTGRSTPTWHPSVLLWRSTRAAGLGGYFRHGSRRNAFGYLGNYAWWRVMRWLRKKHPRKTWKGLRRRSFLKERWPSTTESTLFNPAAMRVDALPLPGSEDPAPVDSWLRPPARPRHSHGLPGRPDRQMNTDTPVESPVRGNSHAGLYVPRTVMLKTRSMRRGSACSARFLRVMCST